MARTKIIVNSAICHHLHHIHFHHHLLDFRHQYQCIHTCVNEIQQHVDIVNTSLQAYLRFIMNYTIDPSIIQSTLHKIHK